LIVQNKVSTVCFFQVLSLINVHLVMQLFVLEVFIVACKLIKQTRLNKYLHIDFLENRLQWKFSKKQ